MKRCQAYLRSLNHHTEFGQETIEDVRSLVRLLNAIYSLNYRVTLMGRLGKDNPRSHLYKDLVKSYRYIHHDDAAYCDVYIQKSKHTKKDIVSKSDVMYMIRNRLTCISK